VLPYQEECCLSFEEAADMQVTQDVCSRIGVACVMLLHFANSADVVKVMKEQSKKNRVKLSNLITFVREIDVFRAVGRKLQGGV
jgi:hypothetical protein